MKIRVRVDAIEDVDDTKVVSFCDQYTSYVIVSHILPHGNPHYHMYIDAPMVMSLDTIRMRVKRYFKTQKPSDYSVKKCDDEKVNEYVQYLFNTKHGNQYKLIKSSNFSDDLLAECIRMASEITTDFEQRQQKRKSNVDKGPTMFQMGIELVDVLKTTHKQNEDISISDYTKCAIQVCHKYNKSCHPNVLINIVSTAMSLTDPERLVRKVQNYFQSE